MSLSGPQQPQMGAKILKVSEQKQIDREIADAIEKVLAVLPPNEAEIGQEVVEYVVKEVATRRSAHFSQGIPGQVQVFNISTCGRELLKNYSERKGGKYPEVCEMVKNTLYAERIDYEKIKAEEDERKLKQAKEVWTNTILTPFVKQMEQKGVVFNPGPVAAMITWFSKNYLYKDPSSKRRVFDPNLSPEKQEDKLKAQIDKEKAEQVQLRQSQEAVCKDWPDSVYSSLVDLIIAAAEIEKTIPEAKKDDAPAVRTLVEIKSKYLDRNSNADLLAQALFRDAGFPEIFAKKLAEAYTNNKNVNQAVSKNLS